eukprot:COSAG01_NODE_5768_length_4046_cov_1.760578_2_plen_96_part_00
MLPVTTRTCRHRPSPLALSCPHLASQAELQRDEQETMVIGTLAPLLPRATAKHNYPTNPEDFQGVSMWCVCVCVCVCVCACALHMSVVVGWGGGC